MPAGGIFSTAGQAGFSREEDLKWTLGLLSSSACNHLISLSQGTTPQDQGGTNPQYEVGLIKRLPWPSPSADLKKELSGLVDAIYYEKASRAATSETSHVFVTPALLSEDRSTGLPLASVRANEDSSKHRVSEHKRRIDQIACDLYAMKYAEESDPSPDGSALEDDISDESDNGADLQVDREESACVKSLISYQMGCIFGRWDLRYATGRLQRPEPLAAFAAMPLCSPGMLSSSKGLPASNTPAGYPLRINWDGLLADDPGHSNDLGRRLREVAEIIWESQAEVIEEGACAIMGVKTLRDYIRRPSKGGFWDDHVSRYSKSRRKAPIYWLLQSSDKNYALWLYYYRLDKDVLFKALVNYVEPKVRLETSRLETLRQQKAAAGESGKEAKRLAKEIEWQDDFLSELRDFEDKLRRAAKLHLEPDLNDGVVLNIAPLHELVPWKEAANYWQELLAGKYEWSSIGKQLRQKGLVN
jgi:hypothetical protein